MVKTRTEGIRGILMVTQPRKINCLSKYGFQPFVRSFLLERLRTEKCLCSNLLTVGDLYY